MLASQRIIIYKVTEFLPFTKKEIHTYVVYGSPFQFVFK